MQFLVMSPCSCDSLVSSLYIVMMTKFSSIKPPVIATYSPHKFLPPKFPCIQYRHSYIYATSQINRVVKVVLVL